MKRSLVLMVMVLMASPTQAFFVHGPDGAYDVMETSQGSYTIRSLSGGGIMTVNKMPNGYMVTPYGEPSTFIDIDPNEQENFEPVLPIAPLPFGIRH